jgi:hypothetical protein
VSKAQGAVRRCGKSGWHNASRPVRHTVGRAAELDRLKGNSIGRQTVLDMLEKSLPEQSASFLVQRKRAWLAGFRAS